MTTLDKPRMRHAALYVVSISGACHTKKIHFLGSILGGDAARSEPLSLSRLRSRC